jgi:hypothetical protein
MRQRLVMLGHLGEAAHVEPLLVAAPDENAAPRRRSITPRRMGGRSFGAPAAQEYYARISGNLHDGPA